MWRSLAADHPSLPGHFPGEPIAPGVVVLDYVIQELAEFAGAKAVVQTVAMVKFIQPIKPGLAFRIDFESLSSNKVKFQVLGQEQQVFCTGQLQYAIDTR